MIILDKEKSGGGRASINKSAFANINMFDSVHKLLIF